MLRAFDAELAQPEIEGVPIGSTLTDLLVIEFLNDGGQWGLAQRWFDRLRRLRCYCHASRPSTEPMPARPGSILLAWRSSTPRIHDLLLPVLQALPADRCTVLYKDPKVLERLPSQADAVDWLGAVSHDRGRWLPAFRRCWPEWRTRLRALCEAFGLPRGAMERLSLIVLVNSQMAIGSLAFLERCRPVAIVTDYDRARLSSCLVLAARSLGIPTFSLQHGVLGQGTAAYVPVIADRMFCWGELHRQVMSEAGQDPAKLVIGGCPRLTRDLPAQSQEVRNRLKIDASRRIVMLGTSPISRDERLRITELFCAGMELLGNATGLVRLHPSEKLETYAETIRRHPTIHFLDNCRTTLDEALSAADVVAVQNSGLGGDALVKRRLAVVIDIPPSPLGHGKDLVERAGCPCVKTPQELADAVSRLLFDEQYRGQRLAAAERFVESFCACFGKESAERIAEMIQQAVGCGGSTAREAVV
jgi:hypothetical protein